MKFAVQIQVRGMKMTDIWDEKPNATCRVDFSSMTALEDSHYDQEEMDAWLKKVKEELRDARAQSRVHRQHRMLYQSQRDELGETLELVDTMVQRSVDYWRESDEGHAEYYVGAYRCVQENIKSIKAKIQSSASKVRNEE